MLLAQTFGPSESGRPLSSGSAFRYTTCTYRLSKELDEWETRVTSLVKDLAARQPSRYDIPARAAGGRRAARRRRRMTRGRRLAEEEESTASLIEAFRANVRAACLNASWNVVEPHGLILPGKVCPPPCTDGPGCLGPLVLRRCENRL